MIDAVAPSWVRLTEMSPTEALDQGTCTARPRPSCSRPDGQRLRLWAPGGSWTNTGTSCEVQS